MQPQYLMIVRGLESLVNRACRALEMLRLYEFYVNRPCHLRISELFSTSEQGLQPTDFQK